MNDLKYYFGGRKNILYRNRVPADMALILRLYHCDIDRAWGYAAHRDSEDIKYNSVLREACLQEITMEQTSFCKIGEDKDESALIGKMEQDFALKYPALSPMYSCFTHETVISIPLYPYRERVDCTSHKLTAYRWRDEINTSPIVDDYITLIEEKTLLKMNVRGDDKKVTKAFLLGDLPLEEFTAYIRLKEKLKTGSFAA